MRNKGAIAYGRNPCAVLSQYILGIRPDYDGLVIAPSIPQDWDGFEVHREFRRKTFTITIHNPNHICHGVTEMVVNGETITGNKVPLEKMKKENTVELVMTA